VFAHPRYHFQLGGYQLERHANNCRLDFFDGLVFLEGPRIAHPPLDGVLAVDFIVSNFGGAQWGAMRKEISYSRVIKSAQRRNWLPYANASCSRWWEKPQSNQWAAADVWPQLS
jgi:hypothetical protein